MITEKVYEGSLNDFLDSYMGFEERLSVGLLRRAIKTDEEPYKIVLLQKGQIVASSYKRDIKEKDVLFINGLAYWVVKELKDNNRCSLVELDTEPLTNPEWAERLSFAEKQKARKEGEEKYNCYFGYSKTRCHRYALVINYKCLVCTIIKINRRWQHIAEKNAKV